MKRFVKWSSIIIVTIALVMCGIYWSQTVKIRQDIMSKSDEDYILMVLRQKSADDCVLREVRPGVWKGDRHWKYETRIIYRKP